MVFAVLALAMFDVVTIDFSRFAGSAGANAGPAKGTVALAFGMGPSRRCWRARAVAPVVIQVVLFSSNLYAHGTLVALGCPSCWVWGWRPWPLAGRA